MLYQHLVSLCQTVASKDQSRIAEPIKELDIMLTQVNNITFSYIKFSHATVLVPKIDLYVIHVLSSAACGIIACRYNAGVSWSSKFFFASAGGPSMWIVSYWFVLAAHKLFCACMANSSHAYLSLCIDAFSLGHPPTILFRRVQIPTNSSLTVSSECHVLPWLLEIRASCRFWYKKSYISRFLGTSGQNIDDLYKYSDAKDKLEFMERTLRWRHLAPTAPNSLGNPSSPAQFGMSTVKIVGL